MSKPFYQTYPETEDMLSQVAISYAKQGIPVYTLQGIDGHGRCECGESSCKHPGKHPNGRLAPHGMKDATTDADRVRAMWKAAPNANIGTITGEPVNRLVIDIDARAGGWESADRLEEQYGSFPATICVRTGGKACIFICSSPRGSIFATVPAPSVRGSTYARTVAALSSHPACTPRDSGTNGRTLSPKVQIWNPPSSPCHRAG
jgi:hypothetical protein